MSEVRAEAADEATARRAELVVDGLILAIIFIQAGACLKIFEVLTVGDWDMWVDWRDRQWYPLLYPLLCLGVPAFVQAVLWTHFRLPFGATITVLALHLCTFLTRWLGHTEWTGFPWSLVWTGTLVPGALLLDTILLLTRNAFVTAIGGGLLYGLVFYPGNWPMIAPYRMVVEHMGQLATVADTIGFTFNRTAMPEYLRIIERGTLRTFGENPAVISALFSSFLCVFVYGGWYALGAASARLPRIENTLRRFMGIA